MSAPRIYVVGDRPGPNTDPARPLYPHTTVGAAAHLMEMMGIDSKQVYLDRTIRMNAWHDGRLTLVAEARPRMLKLMRHLKTEGSEVPLGTEKKPALVIVLGTEAMRAMPADIRDMKFGEVRDVSRWLRVFYLPHTSGRNRVWNDHAYKGQMKEKLIKHVAQFLA